MIYNSSSNKFSISGCRKPSIFKKEESLSLQDKEHEMIKAALEKHRGKRKNAANELGISERTLYRKIKEYNIITRSEIQKDQKE